MFDNIFSDPPLCSLDVFHLLSPKADEWYGIGRELGILKRKRKQNLSNTDEDRLEDVIELWIDKAESPRTWDELKECLERLEFRQILRNVKDFLKKQK